MCDQKYFLVLCLSIVVFLNAFAIRAETSENEFLKFVDLHEPRIINGTEAIMNTTRHQVSIRNKKRDNFFFGTGHLCGGSLISENVVLSAAHCFVNYQITEPRGTFHPENFFSAVMGDLDRFEMNNNTLVFDILKVVTQHEIFNLKTYKNDIALVMLDGKVPANHPTVRPIILNDGPVKTNTFSCQATGWGETEDGFNSDVLMTVDLLIIDLDDCREKTLYKELVAEGMFCAGYLEGEKDTCSGDSGGALVCDGVQTGIISWGSSCAEPLAPGVLTDVAFYKDWILEEVAKNNGTLPKFAGDSSNGETGGGDGATSLSCSIILVSLMFIFNFYLSQTKSFFK